jgi:glucarate dehydratase
LKKLRSPYYDVLMKIQDMHITPIAISDPPLLNAAGLHAPYALRIIVEIVTDNGISGVAEIPCSGKTIQALEQARDAIAGLDPFCLNRIAQALENDDSGTDDTRGFMPWDDRTHNHVTSAVEVACYDIMGKSSDRPVSDLLGGSVRERVPFAAYLFYKREGAGGALGFELDPQAERWAEARQKAALDPEAVVAQAKGMCTEYGFSSIKLKGGALPPDIEVDSVLALYDAFGPDMPVRFDPNAVWAYDTALAAAERMKGKIEYLEDPVRGQEDMARLRTACGIPMATNMCTTSFGDLPTAVELHSEDIILSDHHFWGGLRASVELFRVCQTFGRDLSMHSNSHLGISLAAMVHLGAVMPELPYALDTHYPWQSDEVIVGGRIPIEDGSIAVPKGPGLGVELDRHELARLHAQYLSCGLEERDDAAEMAKIDPSWEFKAVRW